MNSSNAAIIDAVSHWPMLPASRAPAPESAAPTSSEDGPLPLPRRFGRIRLVAPRPQPMTSRRSRPAAVLPSLATNRPCLPLKPKRNNRGHAPDGRGFPVRTDPGTVGEAQLCSPACGPAVVLSATRRSGGSSEVGLIPKERSSDRVPANLDAESRRYRIAAVIALDQRSQFCGMANNQSNFPKRK